MNKWFIIYCVYTLYNLTNDVVTYTNGDYEHKEEWAIVLAFLLLLFFRLWIVYLAVRQGF